MNRIPGLDEPVQMSDQTEKVGYKRPPRQSQFKPGQSGNPRGRTKAKRTMQSIVIALLEQKIWVTLPSGRKQISVEEAIFLRLREQALKGDLKVVQFLLDRRHSPTAGCAGDASGENLSKEDLAILAEAGLLPKSEAQSDVKL